MYGINKKRQSHNYASKINRIHINMKIDKLFIKQVI